MTTPDSMTALLQAIMTKFTGSAASTDVGGRIYIDEPDVEEPTLPYIVLFIVSSTLEKTFTEEIRTTLIQFSIYDDKDASPAGIAKAYSDLKALFDDCSLTIPPTGTVTDTLIWMTEEGLQTMMDPGSGIRHWAVDYEVKTSLK